MGLYRKSVETFDYDVGTSGTHLHGYVDASLLRDVKDHTLRLELLEAFGGHRDVVRSLTQTGDQVFARGVAGRGVADALVRVADRDLRVGYDSTRAIVNCSRNG